MDVFDDVELDEAVEETMEGRVADTVFIALMKSTAFRKDCATKLEPVSSHSSALYCKLAAGATPSWPEDALSLCWPPVVRCLIEFFF